MGENMQTLLDAQKSILVGIDIQEKLIDVMYHKQRVLKNANILLQGARILGVKTILSEQYPRGLGKTDSSLKFRVIDDFSAPLDENNENNKNDETPQVRLFEKISFSIFNDSALRSFLQDSQCKSLIFFGIETHICILQSAIMALEMGFEVWLIEDCLSSRNKANHNNALCFMRSQGAKIINTESFLFGFLSQAKGAQFKAISGLIK
ncbi:isochorismatase family protein [Helicobacter himalayensis]|uniref:isochorismatase family protein n=1 Tax=Helicobacter himalayensis TaxID=1591088 RepID=UPI003D6FC153